MSIGYKKITELIDEEVEGIDVLTARQKDLLSDLCTKLYMLESSVEYQSASRLIDEMLAVIGNAADKFKNEDGI